MDAWSTFWRIVLIATLASFIPLVVVVAVSGWVDIGHLFGALRKLKRNRPK